MKAFLSVISLTVLLLLSACASANFERNAYVTLGSIGATANAAIGAYHSYIQLHGTDQEELRTARVLVQNYLTAMETARAGVLAYKQGLATKDQVTSALDALAAASSKLTQFLAHNTQDL